MPCNVCHSKNAETVDFLSLGEADQCALQQKKIGLCVNCVSAKPVQTPFLVQSPFHLQLQPALLLLLLLLVPGVLPPPRLRLLLPRAVLRVLCFKTGMWAVEGGLKRPRRGCHPKEPPPPPFQAHA